MKKTVVRLLMVLSFLIGSCLWFLFLPVQAEIGLSISFTGLAYLDVPLPEPGDQIRVEHMVHSYFGPGRRGFKVKLIRVNDAKSVTVEMKRWQYFWYCDGNTWWYLGHKNNPDDY